MAEYYLLSLKRGNVNVLLFVPGPEQKEFHLLYDGHYQYYFNQSKEENIAFAGTDASAVPLCCLSHDNDFIFTAKLI